MPRLTTFSEALKHIKNGGYAIASPDQRTNKIFTWKENRLMCMSPIPATPDNSGPVEVNDSYCSLERAGWVLLRSDMFDTDK